MTVSVGPFRELWSTRGLLYAWTRRSLQIRYKQSLLGVLWAILQPLALMLVFTFVRVILAPSDGSSEIPYPLLTYAVLVPWTLLSSSLASAVPSLVGSMDLVRKIYFPREILPLSAIGVALVDAAVASLVLLGMLVVFGLAPTVTWLWIPLVILVELVLITGCALLGSIVNGFFRDVRFVLPLGLQLWMFASPVIYTLSEVQARLPEGLYRLYLLNPMAGILDAFQGALLEGRAPDGPAFTSAAVISVALLLVGAFVFRRFSGTIADVL